MPTTEPAISIGAITAAVAALIALLVAFGVDFTQSQQVAILGTIAGLGPIVAAILTRAKVTPAAQVAAVVAPSGDIVAGPALLRVPDGAPVAVTVTPAVP